MGVNLIKFAEEGNSFINKLATELGCSEEKALRIMKAVLHAFRDRIQVGESLHFISQMPLFLKAFYVDGWKYQEKPERVKTLQEFGAKVMEEAGRTAEFDFANPDEAIIASKSVFNMLSQYVGSGELNNLAAILPLDLRWLVAPEHIDAP